MMILYKYMNLETFFNRVTMAVVITTSTPFSVQFLPHASDLHTRDKKFKHGSLYFDQLWLMLSPNIPENPSSEENTMMFYFITGEGGGLKLI